MANNVMSLTRAGLQLYGKIQRGECSLTITRIIAGSGELSEGEDIIDLVALKNPVDVEIAITSNTIIGDGQTQMGLTFGESETDYYLREIGVMATDPDEGEILYAYCNFGSYADFISAYSGQYTFTQEGIIFFSIGNATEVIFNSDGVVQVSRTEFLGHTNNNDNPHNVTAEQVGITNLQTLLQITAATLQSIADSAAAAHEHDNKSVIDDITAAVVANWNAAHTHVSSRSNPHGVTKAQVGLGNVTNESKATMFTNPTFTGIPAAPTAPADADNTQVANTAFVQAAIDAELNNIRDYIDIAVAVTFEPSEDYSPGRWSITTATGSWHVGDNSNITIDTDSANDEFDDMMYLYGYVLNGIPHIGLSVDGTGYTKYLVMRGGGTYTIRLYKIIA